MQSCLRLEYRGVNMVVRVGMADLNVCQVPDTITTLGLGSCVGIVLYDPEKKIAGLVHIMLPDSTQIIHNENVAKFADTGIMALIKKMVALGARSNRLIAKIAGGAQMFGFQSNNELLRVGVRNVEATKKQLELLRIPIVAEDTGKNYGRTIEFSPESGILSIRSVGREINKL